ncbi:MAG: PVC-type heme-binding CxxCH protein, partial [Limisphaerales bacterium]
MNFKGALLALATFVAAQPAMAQQDNFADVIRKTGPLTPEEEVKTFHLPPGFEAQLVASEPDIGKPMNMAFDSKGRLWITQSREYPFPVLPVEKPGRDKVIVIEDFDANGHAHKFTTFKTGLNIPIGLYPYKDGVITFSIPKIHFFEDTDGDLNADKDTVLLSGFGYQKDTHGLTSNFRRGFDGWVYADHGFNNDSTVVGIDGTSITMNSGNCYRFHPDGTHVEQHSHGQVNPFGLMFDPLGDLWSADCHSAPTYYLMHGAYYPSFGKPSDGLGFAPDVCTHSHGSTAICGMLFYDDDQWPAEYRWNTFIGNVMTCKINRDSYIEHGSTRVAKEQPDFLSSDDPWFRPVNIEFGPDGAMYVADFYNRIIGHYEVPLDHPGRDRERGRIWRIVYTGAGAKKERLDALV